MNDKMLKIIPSVKRSKKYRICKNYRLLVLCIFNLIFKNKLFQFKNKEAIKFCSTFFVYFYMQSNHLLKVHLYPIKI